MSSIVAKLLIGLCLAINLAALVCMVTYGTLVLTFYNQEFLNIGEDIPRVNNVEDIPQDWKFVPFTGIASVDSSMACPDGSISLFESIWYGISEACDCRDGYVLDALAVFKQGYTCYPKTDWTCESVEPVPAIRQNIFGGKRFCGTQNGYAFLNVTRPNLNNECPEGYSSCSDYTSAENTYCFPTDEMDNCPILDIQLVSQDLTDHPSYSYLSFNSTTKIAYTKNAVGIDQKPATSIRLENQPCSNQFQQSSGAPDTIYVGELSQGTCEYNSQTDSTYDSRYKNIGLQTTDYDIQTENGVTDIIGSVPLLYMQFGDMSVKKESMVSGWTRPTIDWSLECESDGKTRTDAIEILKNNSLDYIMIQTKVEGMTTQMLFCWILCWFSPVGLAPIFEEANIPKAIFGNFVAPAGLIFVLYYFRTKVNEVQNWIDEQEQNIVDIEALNPCLDAWSQVNVDAIYADFWGPLEQRVQNLLNWNLWAMILQVAVAVYPALVFLGLWNSGKDGCLYKSFQTFLTDDMGIKDGENDLDEPLLGQDENTEGGDVEMKKLENQEDVVAGTVVDENKSDQ